jgi:hypothetical protein
MELKDFIKETITQIVNGVVEAQTEISQHGAEINPKRVQFREAGQYNHYNSGKPQYVEFDVGLTSIQKSGSSEGIGVFLGSISLGKKNDEGAEHTAVSRIKFSLPVVLPSGTGEHLD